MNGGAALRAPRHAHAAAAMLPHARCARQPHTWFCHTLLPLPASRYTCAFSLPRTRTPLPHRMRRICGLVHLTRCTCYVLCPCGAGSVAHLGSLTPLPPPPLRCVRHLLFPHARRSRCLTYLSSLAHAYAPAGFLTLLIPQLSLFQPYCHCYFGCCLIDLVPSFSLHFLHNTLPVVVVVGVTFVGGYCAFGLRWRLSNSTARLDWFWVLRVTHCHRTRTHLILFWCGLVYFTLLSLACYSLFVFVRLFSECIIVCVCVYCYGGVSLIAFCNLLQPCILCDA